jgi:hypothetical protein
MPFVVQASSLRGQGARSTVCQPTPQRPRQSFFGKLLGVSLGKAPDLNLGKVEIKV